MNSGDCGEGYFAGSHPFFNLSFTMQGQPYQLRTRIPYSKWAQHRADNGLIYLAHPVTGEVKWLWSRHHDPKTANDYLVNTVTGERTWVTKQNEHLCPIKPNGADSVASKGSQSPGGSKATNPFADMPKAPAKVHMPDAMQQEKPPNSGYREIAAPKSLGLTADEVLMLVPKTGRRYIFNKKTNSSRWLPDRAPDTIASEGVSKGLFGRGNSAKSSSSPFDEEELVTSELRERIGKPGSTVDSSGSYQSGQYPSRPATQAGPSRSPHGTPTQSMQRPSSGLQTSQFPPRSPAPQSKGHAPQRGEKHNGYPQVTPSHTGDEAAMIIQRAVRSDIVRRADVLGKLRMLTNVLADVREITTSGKYEMNSLRTIAEKNRSVEEIQGGAQRLLELGEYLTQQMLKVDAVESSGNQLVRGKRKLSVKVILGLTDEVDALRRKLQRE